MVIIFVSNPYSSVSLLCIQSLHHMDGNLGEDKYFKFSVVYQLMWAAKLGKVMLILVVADLQ